MSDLDASTEAVPNTRRYGTQPAYTQRERALFAEITQAEEILTSALGLGTNRSPDETITVLAAKAAAVVREHRVASRDFSSIQGTAADWVTNIDHWLATKNTEERSPDYEAGFVDGWSHAAKILRTLFDDFADLDRR